MKLLTKTTLYIATLSLFLFFIMGIIFFQILKSMSINELNREMTAMRAPVEDHLQIIMDHGITKLPGLDSLIIHPVEQIPLTYGNFRDTMMFDHAHEIYRTYRIHTFFASIQENTYRVELVKSTTPTDKLVEKVTLMMTIMVILFLSGIFILNRFIFANLWKDFFHALFKLRTFESEKKPILSVQSDIQEFNELNEVLEGMTSRLANDYRELREYTDNTTHELQTPLAVIKSKIELLLQSENLDPGDLELIKGIYTNADHLSRLNSTLAMITRIENRQYVEKSEINFQHLIDHHLELLQELIGLRNIQIRKKFISEDALVRMNRGLADILVINMLKNAIVHNSDGGMIEIELSNAHWTIKNTGPRKAIPADRLFDRFYKGSKTGGSFGLGLPLVKKICDYYDFGIEYRFVMKWHSFTIIFSS